MMRKTLVTAVVLALGCGVANADTNTSKLSKQASTGMMTGAVTGAVVGGPIGAAVGFFVGAIIGDTIGTAQRADLRAQQLENELGDARLALSQASEQKQGEEMLEALAQRLHADVMFRTGGADLDPQVVSELAELGKLLAAHSQLEVQLHGFADPRGRSEKNLELSLRRADAVREALVKAGAAPEQIQITAHGEDLTTAGVGDVEAYAWERRVSLAIQPVGAKVADLGKDAQVAQTK